MSTTHRCPLTRADVLLGTYNTEETKPHKVDEDERLYLDKVYAAIQITSNISAVRRSINRELDNRITKATSRQALAAERIRSAITLFLEHWRDYAPDDSGDVDLSGAFPAEA